MAASLPACGLTVHEQTSKQRATPARPVSRLLEEARKTFEATCAGCHGLDGRGGERGPNIATRQEVVRRSDSDLLKTLRNGITASGMPSFAALGNAKLSALVSYLRSLQGKGASVAIPGDPQRGEAIFIGVAGCSTCHMVQGRGGFIGPDLTGYAARSSANEIRKVIVSPGKDSSQRRGVVRVTLRDGRRWEGIVRNEDNFSLQLQSLDGSFHLIQKSEVMETIPSERPLMPGDYGKTLTPSQLDDLVGYLMSAARKAMAKAPTKQNWDED